MDSVASRSDDVVLALERVLGAPGDREAWDHAERVLAARRTLQDGAPRLATAMLCLLFDDSMQQPLAAPAMAALTRAGPPSSYAEVFSRAGFVSAPAHGLLRRSPGTEATHYFMRSLHRQAQPPCSCVRCLIGVGFSEASAELVYAYWRVHARSTRRRDNARVLTSVWPAHLAGIVALAAGGGECAPVAASTSSGLHALSSVCRSGTRQIERDEVDDDTGGESGAIARISEKLAVHGYELWFHGTIVDSYESMCEYGVEARSRWEQDFGAGNDELWPSFYMGSAWEVAAELARTRAVGMDPRAYKSRPCVVVFAVPSDAIRTLRMPCRVAEGGARWEQYVKLSWHRDVGQLAREWPESVSAIDAVRGLCAYRGKGCLNERYVTVYRDFEQLALKRHSCARASAWMAGVVVLQRYGGDGHACLPTRKLDEGSRCVVL